jgi:hypothetical protein
VNDGKPILFIGGPWDGKWLNTTHHTYRVHVRNLRNDVMSTYGGYQVEPTPIAAETRYRFVRLMGTVGVMLADELYDAPDYLAKALEKLVKGYRVVEQL